MMLKFLLIVDGIGIRKNIVIIYGIESLMLTGLGKIDELFFFCLSGVNWAGKYWKFS
jgi:hypothetical protein